MSWGYESCDRRDVFVRVLDKNHALLRMDHDKFVERMDITGAESLKQAQLLAVEKACERAKSACQFKYYQIRMVSNDYLAGKKTPKSLELSSALSRAQEALHENYSNPTVVFLEAPDEMITAALADRALRDLYDNEW